MEIITREVLLLWLQEHDLGLHALDGIADNLILEPDDGKFRIYVAGLRGAVEVWLHTDHFVSDFDVLDPLSIDFFEALERSLRRKAVQGLSAVRGRL